MLEQAGHDVGGDYLDATLVLADARIAAVGLDGVVQGDLDRFIVGLLELFPEFRGERWPIGR